MTLHSRTPNAERRVNPRPAPALRRAGRSTGHACEPNNKPTQTRACHPTRSASSSLTAHRPLPTAHVPHGLTLIELLVTIVILVTLIAAVLPAISPNNDSRKVREASRQLVSLFAQAQAQAARDGRPVGVGFRDPETWNDADNDGFQDPGEVTYTGMALEAYIIAEPPPFTGFNTSSAVGVLHDGMPYAPLSANTPTTKPSIPPGGEPPLVNLQFGHGVGGEGMTFDASDEIPPQMFRGAEFVDDDSDGIFEAEGSGDIVQVGQELFELVINDCDDVDDTDSDPDTIDFNGQTYLDSQLVVTARWLTWRFRPIELLSPGGKAFRIRRQAMAAQSPSRTAAEALQFPRGVGVDFDPSDGDGAIGIVFSPNGSVQAIYQDGDKTDADEPVFILLGRVENANPITAPTNDIDYTRYTFDGSESDDDLAQRRQEVNLLNPDSRWVVVSPAGRVISAENAQFDPRTTAFVDGTPANNAPAAQRDRQRDAARQYAAQLQTEGGG